MPNGKVLWLCEQHEKLSHTQTDEKYKEQLHTEPADDKKPELSDDEVDTPGKCRGSFI